MELLEVGLKSLIQPLLDKTMKARIVIVKDRWNANGWNHWCVLYDNKYEWQWVSIDNYSYGFEREKGSKEELLFDVIKEEFTIMIFNKEIDYYNWHLKHIQEKIDKELK